MKDNSLTIVFKLMKWCVKVVLLITGVLPLARCGSGYKENRGKVTFDGEEITDKSFIVLNEVFGKDDSAAYYKRYSIRDADIATFTGLDRHYAKDKATVYYCDEEREGQNYYLTKHSVIIKVKDASPATFTMVGEGYAKDSKRAYFQGIGFEVKDVGTLSVLEGQFVKDKYQVYFDQVPVKGADVNTFRTLSNCYARDTACAYYYGHRSDLYNGIHKIPCVVSSLTILDYPYSRDTRSVFYLYTKIDEADAGTFSIVGKDFSKDKNHVFSKTKILKGADPITFMLLPLHEGSPDENYYSKDKDHAFWKDKMFSVADISAFKALGLGYATDGKHVYYHTDTVRNADPSSFKAYTYSHTDADAEDKNNKYQEGIKVVEE